MYYGVYVTILYFIPIFFFSFCFSSTFLVLRPMITPHVYIIIILYTCSSSSIGIYTVCVCVCVPVRSARAYIDGRIMSSCVRRGTVPTRRRVAADCITRYADAPPSPRTVIGHLLRHYIIMVLYR